MADDAAIAMEMATLALASAAADAAIVPGIDAAAAVPPVNTQPVATVGESIPAPVFCCWCCTDCS
jgi:hypothetical protein